jgi:hypothetical protein
MNHRHEVQLEHFKGFVVEHDMANSVGMGSDKRLQIFVNTQTQKMYYQVKDHALVLYKGKSLKKAVEKYNKAS